MHRHHQGVVCYRGLQSKHRHAVSNHNCMGVGLPEQTMQRAHAPCAAAWATSKCQGPSHAPMADERPSCCCFTPSYVPPFVLAAHPPMVVVRGSSRTVRTVYRQAPYRTCPSPLRTSGTAPPPAPCAAAVHRAAQRAAGGRPGTPDLWRPAMPACVALWDMGVQPPPEDSVRCMGVCGMMHGVHMRTSAWVIRWHGRLVMAGGSGRI